MNPKVAPFFAAIKSINYKNNGGCLFFCYAFWLWLKKNELPTDTFEIVQYQGGFAGTWQVEHNQKWINTNGESGNPESSRHFSWMYEGQEYDSDGLFNKRILGDDGCILDGLNTGYVELIDKFCHDALNYSGWNSMFDRAEAKRVVLLRLDLDMSHV